eukprot:CAMPEP_0178622236 /NCGR_PEP_ID=MMETSP0698-20121128/6223_1 /TAXON_ID=265572 /ORGANISM="Extubocellulus spinifer, Strain CCMP396" /LENGTH=108 /DNA_ID=CAMNT_0020261291 /DNA_START=121 /DNA_END=447 /DNA_ORIENTATION=+
MKRAVAVCFLLSLLQSVIVLVTASDPIETDYWVSAIPKLDVACVGDGIKAGRSGGSYPQTKCLLEGEAICFDNVPGSFGRWTFGVKDRTINLMVLTACLFGVASIAAE